MTSREIAGGGNSRLRLLHIWLFCSNIGFTAVLMLYSYAPNSVTGRLNQLDNSISTSLNVRKTDFATHYFMFFFLALVFTLCLGLILYLIARSPVFERILRTVPGFFSIAVLPAMSLNPWSNIRYLEKILSPLEIALVLYLTFRYLQGKWPRSTWTISVVMAVHFLYWSREFGPYDALRTLFFRFSEFRTFMLFAPDGAPVAWTVAFGSALVWTWRVAADWPQPARMTS